MARAYGPDELGKIKISKEEKFDFWFSIINKELLEQNEHRWFVWYSVFTEIELSNEFCSELAIRYVEAGWYVVAYASVELDEGTVTHFVFLTKESFAKWMSSKDYREHNYKLITGYETALEWSKRENEVEIKDEKEGVLDKMAIRPEVLIEKKILSKREEYIRQLDEELLKNEPMFEWFEASIQGELPIVLRNAIAEEYVKSGWHKVYHHTTSENGERPGLTCFVFLTEDTESMFDRIHCHNLDTYWQVSEEGVYKSPIKVTNK